MCRDGACVLCGLTIPCFHHHGADDRIQLYIIRLRLRLASGVWGPAFRPLLTLDAGLKTLDYVTAHQMAAA
jgi:hypothetical protein